MLNALDESGKLSLVPDRLDGMKLGVLLSGRLKQPRALRAAR